MSQPVGYQYKSRIPTLSDDASIVEALMVYHYGVDNYTTQPIPDDSIEGNFRTLHNEVDTINSFISNLGITYVEQVSLAASPNIITAQNTTTTPLTIRGISSQTSPLLEIQSSSSANIGSITTAGNMNLQGYVTVGSTTQSTTTGINVVIGNASHKGIVVKAQTSQTENLQEWQDSSETILANVSASGGFSVASLTSLGNISASGGTFTGNVSVLSPDLEDSNGVRQIKISTSEPIGGADGDVWLIYQ